MDSASFQQRMQRIEELIATIQEHGNPVVRASAVDLVRTLLDIHRAALEEMLVQIVRRGEAGQAIMKEYLQSDLITCLLLLHGLHPVDLPTRLQQAIEQSRLRLRTYGADVELAQASHEAVSLRVRGGSGEVQRLLEEAILAAAPDILRIEFVDADTSDTGRRALTLVHES
jgi:hypothetical protein